MVKFKLGNTEFDYFDFAKHHRRMPIHIGRTSEDGMFEDLIKSETFRQDVADNPEATFIAHNQIYKDNRLQPVKDLYVWLENAEYIERNMPYYSIGSCNTSQTAFVRLAFQFEDAVAFLEHEIHTSGTYAMSFRSFLNNSYIVSEVIDELLEKKLTLDQCGIESLGEDAYRILVVSQEKGWVDGIEVEMRELKESLIGVEIYDFKQEVHDENLNDKVEKEEEQCV